MPFAHQRLAAGDTNAPHAEADEGVGHRVKFLQAEDLIAGKELHVFAHAVGAAEVAAIRHRQAQVGDATAEGIDQAGIGHSDSFCSGARPALGG